MPITVMSL